MGHSLRLKYGQGVAVIAGSATSLGKVYTSYLLELGYRVIVLLDSDAQALVE
jgi:hypothetical protein